MRGSGRRRKHDATEDVGDQLVLSFGLLESLLAMGAGEIEQAIGGQGAELLGRDFGLPRIRFSPSETFGEALGRRTAKAVRVRPKIRAGARCGACLVPPPRACVCTQERCVLGPTVGRKITRERAEQRVGATVVAGAERGDRLCESRAGPG